MYAMHWMETVDKYFDPVSEKKKICKTDEFYRVDELCARSLLVAMNWQRIDDEA